jgi:TetR/AcrR family transcriptional regulator, regulator of cefoperazone and chloramphenicol sensitivity
MKRPETIPSDDTRTRILHAAGPVFADKGFDAATVREICAVADVNIASIKYYFGDKRGLYLETVLFARHLRAERYPIPDREGLSTPEERLYEFVAMLLRRLTALGDAPWPVRLLMRELIKPDETCRQIVRDYFKPTLELLLNEIDALAGRKLSESDRLKYGFSVIGQCIHYRFGREIISLIVPESLKGEFGIEQIASHITRFTISAIRNIPPSGDGATDDSIQAGTLEPKA